MSNKCSTCSEGRRCARTTASWVFFLIGIIATISVRAVAVLLDINPLYAKAAWYTGIIGFLAFFIYKFRVEHERAGLIRREDLVAKVKEGRILDRKESDTVAMILCAISTSKDKINYFFIFSSSVIALIWAVYFDFIKK